MATASKEKEKQPDFADILKGVSVIAPYLSAKPHLTAAEELARLKDKLPSLNNEQKKALVRAVQR